MRVIYEDGEFRLSKGPYREPLHAKHETERYFLERADKDLHGNLQWKSLGVCSGEQHWLAQEMDKRIRALADATLQSMAILTEETDG